MKPVQQSLVAFHCLKPLMCFELDCVVQGQAALALVQKARQEDRPYPVAFVDMRMPPGWRGLETIEHF